MKLPKGFVFLNDAIPELVVDLRYATPENFMGRPVEGYSHSKIIGTLPLAEALTKVQKQLSTKKLGLKVFDAYRPQRAVDDFIRWSKVSSDTLKKNEYYPQLHKDSLFKLGYIASKSGHSRGSTVDLTLIYTTGKDKGIELDMGGSWDFFGNRSHFAFKEITPIQKANRTLLKTVMLEMGFVPYEKEWWHFTLQNEPYPNTYFDFIP
ncbi:MAG: M15 family metallopeptidase [Flavobacteriaceae bacterium]